MNVNRRLLKWTERAAMIWCAISAAGLLSNLAWPTKPLGVSAVEAVVLASLLLCVLHATATKGWRKALGFSALSFVISWIVEFVGCNYGWWFGDYAYTPVLGWAIGNVPLIVVISWETVIYPSHLLVDDLTQHLGGNSRRGQWIYAIAAALATGLVTTTWDLMADPLSVHQNYWTWDFGGPYMEEIAGGIPFSNFWGWIGAVFIISLLYRLMFDMTPAQGGRHVTSPFATFQFTSLFLGAATGLIQHQLYLPCFIGVFTMGPIILLSWSRLFSQIRAAESETAATAFAGAR